MLGGTLSRGSTYSGPVSSQTPLHLLYLNHSPPRSFETLSRKPSESDVQDQLGRQEERNVIPSSQSPSPVKGSPSRDASVPRMHSLSPHKAAPPPVPNDVTKALQANITSMLGKGKRRSQEEADGGRGGKRARPARSKVRAFHFILCTRLTCVSTIAYFTPNVTTKCKRPAI